MYVKPFSDAMVQLQKNKYDARQRAVSAVT